jgi:hypothetical protein
VGRYCSLNVSWDSLLETYEDEPPNALFIMNVRYDWVYFDGRYCSLNTKITGKSSANTKFVNDDRKMNVHTSALIKTICKFIFARNI